MDISLITAHLMPALVIFLAALMQAITGFGLVIIAAPLLMIFYDPKLTVLIMFVVAMCTNIVQLPFVFREARTRVVAVIIIGLYACTASWHAHLSSFFQQPAENPGRFRYFSLVTGYAVFPSSFPPVSPQ